MNPRHTFLPGAAIVATLCASLATFAATPSSPERFNRYGDSPMFFEPNVGQSTDVVRFIAHGSRYGLFLTNEGATLDLSRDARHSVAFKMTFSGAAQPGSLSAEQPLPSQSNYFVGDSKNWHTGVANFARVRYSSVYPGIDAVFYGNQRQLEYDFDVAAGADPSQIGLHIAGADKLSLTADGALEIHADGRSIVFHAPIAYQQVNGTRHSVASHFVLRGKDEIGFAMDPYDKTRSLVIDPTLVYSSYLGGSGDDEGDAVTVDGYGYTYVTGGTVSLDFPHTAGAYLKGSAYRIFVTKIKPDGTGLVYSATIGGSKGLYGNAGLQTGRAIAVDDLGAAYVVGDVDSTNFPITSDAIEPANATTAGLVGVAFALSPNASRLLYSTYVGGNTYASRVNGVALDRSRNAYITGFTSSSGLPVTPGAFQTVAKSGEEAFAAKINPSGSAYVYATYLSGNDTDQGTAIAVDGNGSAYVTGWTGCATFPSTPNAFQPTCQGPYDVFVVKLNASGSALSYGTFLHAPIDFNLGPTGIALDVHRNAYVVGRANAGLPTTPGAFQASAPGNGDGFVVKLNATGSTELYATYLGGSTGDDFATGVKVDLSGRAYLSGHVIGTTDFPVTANAYQSTLHTFGGPVASTRNAFLTRLNANGTGLDYSTYFGTRYALALSLALDLKNNVVLTGLTSYNDIPITANAFDKVASNNGALEAWVAKFSFGTTGTCTPAQSGALICSPVEGDTVGTTVPVTAGATAEPGLYIKSIRFYVDNVAKATVSTSGNPTSFETSKSLTLTPGTHRISIVAFQSASVGLTASVTVNVQ
ncbi:cell surface glycoprotein [Candidatus Koribacter versatilis Ellin345]|uniref:Cell surface glycoprotein n=1 Tax=Koribacter versatilis (strain Ellin345) TaxID=204669 RepID=Q1IUU9_KORVE|nr:SBBP repeat-containing protein [Candidatus Koribacter versatilis]ABF39351.1 cell surface glycoprotein [Candidatus Koribacter versatilis Ellin345]